MRNLDSWTCLAPLRHNNPAFKIFSPIYPENERKNEIFKENIRFSEICKFLNMVEEKWNKREKMARNVICEKSSRNMF
jgi:hypothetical protein